MSIFNLINGVSKKVSKPFIIVNNVNKTTTYVKNNIGGTYKTSWPNLYKVFIYHNGSLYTTLQCYEGMYATLPNLESIKGYTTTNGGTTVQYTSGLLISVTKNTTLYAVYKKTYTLKIYHDGSLYKNYSQYEGTTSYSTK